MPHVNADLVRRVMKQIKQDPNHWSQWSFISTDEVASPREMCGTTMCFAGWALYLDMGAARFFEEVFERGKDGRYYVKDDYDFDFESNARKALGLTGDQARSLFYRYTTYFEDFKKDVEVVTGVDLSGLDDNDDKAEDNQTCLLSST